MNYSRRDEIGGMVIALSFLATCDRCPLSPVAAGARSRSSSDEIVWHWSW